MESAAERPSQILGRQVREIRERQRMTQQELADAVGMTQASIARTETGRRGATTLDEAVALAAALGVSPVRLFVPMRDATPVAILQSDQSELIVSPRRARQWVRGQQPLPGQDERTFRTELADDEWQAAREVGVRFLLHEVQRLVSATIREDRNAAADAVDAINNQLAKLEAAERQRFDAGEPRKAGIHP